MDQRCWRVFHRSPPDRASGYTWNNDDPGFTSEAASEAPPGPVLQVEATPPNRLPGRGVLTRSTSHPMTAGRWPSRAPVSAGGLEDGGAQAPRDRASWRHATVEAPIGRPQTVDIGTGQMRGGREGDQDSRPMDNLWRGLPVKDSAEVPHRVSPP